MSDSSQLHKVAQRDHKGLVRFNRRIRRGRYRERLRFAGRPAKR